MADVVKARVFYSWQSDTPNSTNRGFILKALEDAVKEIARDDSVEVEPVVDRDTLGVAGSPDISSTILKKIAAADVVVADVTIINQGSIGRPTPNPNVMLEVGYALAVHTQSRLILVNNLAFGRPEDLPFDLRQKRTLTYTSTADAPDRATQRRAMQAALKTAIGAVFMEQGVASRVDYPCKLSMTFRVERQNQDLHEYILEIGLENISTRRLNDWHVDVEIPQPILKSPDSQIGYVSERSYSKVALFRFNDDSFGGPIYPGDTRIFTVSYQMTTRLFNYRGQFFAQFITARAYAEGSLAAEDISEPVSDMQCF